MKIKFNLEKNYKIILLLIILFGLSLRLINIGKDLLWVDEAETVINSLQVINDGYPNAYFEGEPIYENGDSIKAPINDPIYRYASSNYLGSKYENNKGWFTYYYLAPWLKIFNWSELSARLPFLLFYILTIILIFLLSEKLWKNKKISLLACFLFAIDFWSIEYGQQARYYSPLIFSSLLTLYFNYLYILNKKNRFLFLTTSALLLTFHIHIIAFLVIAIFLFYYDLIKNKYLKINRLFLYNLLYLLFGTLPWLILVKFWVNFYTHLNGQDVDNNEATIAKLFWLIIVFLIYSNYKILNKLLPQYNTITKKIIPEYLSIFTIIFIIFIPLLIPGESWSSRIFIPLLPIIMMMMANILHEIFGRNNKYFKYQLFQIIILSSLYFILFFAMNNQINAFKTDWIRKTLAYSNNNGFQKNDIIITNWQVLSFILYSEKKVYDIRVIRPDFINNYPHRILAVFWLADERGVMKNASFQEKQNGKYYYLSEKYFKNIERFKNCQKNNIDENVIILDCPPLDNTVPATLK